MIHVTLEWFYLPQSIAGIAAEIFIASYRHYSVLFRMDTIDKLPLCSNIYSFSSLDLKELKYGEESLDEGVMCCGMYKGVPVNIQTQYMPNIITSYPSNIGIYAYVQNQLALFK